MKKIYLLSLLILATLVFSSCTKFKGYCEVCNYKLRSIDSYLSQYTSIDGTFSGSHFLGTGSMFGTLHGESYSTSNIFCVIEDEIGTIQIKTIPSSRCDIKIINDSTKRRVVAYRSYNLPEEAEGRGIRYNQLSRCYLSASSTKDIINNNFIGYNACQQEEYTIKYSIDTVQYFSNGKADLDKRDSEYDYNKDKYDLSNECTYYIFYVLEKDIITLSELK